MYYPDDKNVLEATDISDVKLVQGNVEPTGAISLPTGERGFLVFLKLNDNSGKSYADGEAPAQMHLTNGVWHHMFALTPAVDLNAAPAAEAAEESPTKAAADTTVSEPTDQPATEEPVQTATPEETSATETTAAPVETPEAVETVAPVEVEATTEPATEVPTETGVTDNGDVVATPSEVEAPVAEA